MQAFRHLRTAGLALAAAAIVAGSSTLPAAAAEKDHQKSPNAGYENPFQPIIDVTYLGKTEFYSPSMGPGTKFRFKVENDGLGAANWVAVSKQCHYTRPDGSQYWKAESQHIQYLGAGQATEVSYGCAKVRGSDFLWGGRLNAGVSGNAPGSHDTAQSW